MKTMKKVSEPGTYSGYSEAIYHGWKRFSQYVMMRDGVKIAVDYYRPVRDGIVEEKPLPVIWIFTPYDYRTLFATERFADGTAYTPYVEEDTMGAAKRLVSHGYVFAAAEVRGTGASFGYRQTVNGDQEAWDGYELCHWLAHQSWCNGKVGTMGYSYYGATQLEMLRKNPPALRAAFIGMTDLDKYDGWVRGGSLRAFGTQPDAGYLEDLNHIPVGDPDDEEAKKQLKQAVQQHKYSSKQRENMKGCPYRDSWCEETDSRLWENLSHTTYLDDINKSQTAVYLYGGWRDVFRRDTVVMYENLKLRKKMLLGPWHHMDYRPGFDLAAEQLRFFGYWLKGIDNQIMNQDPIYYSVGNLYPDVEWTFARKWPPEGMEHLSLFLGEGKSGTASSVNDGSLSLQPPKREEQKDLYQVRYDIEENLDDDTETVDRDSKGLTYTSHALKEELIIAGHPIMELWISSTSNDGDFFIFLEDVDETGKGHYITDGKLRASLRSVSKAPYDYLGLPWHRCSHEDEHKLKPGKPYRLQIDLLPTAYRFKKGHRIRVTITCACSKIYYLEEEHPPVISVYRDSIHTSYLRIPARKQGEDLRREP